MEEGHQPSVGRSGEVSAGGHDDGLVDHDENATSPESIVMSTTTSSPEDDTSGTVLSSGAFKRNPEGGFVRMWPVARMKLRSYVALTGLRSAEATAIAPET